MKEKVDLAALPGSKYEFVELDRTFHELSERDETNDEAEISLALHFGKHLHWSDLLQEYRVIILSEAGSGKTAEIRHTARTLREQGQPAFFIRLEHIPRDFEDSFEVGTHEAFKEWLTSSEEGWLFLDSVDEARLRSPRDFELALRKLSRQIITAQDRTHIVITGRTTAWRPKTDLAYCRKYFPYGAAGNTEGSPKEGDDSSKSVAQTRTTEGKPLKIFKIVAFDNLTRHQISVFAQSRGIQNSDAFLDAVERADAWSFTSRPQDLEELTEFWLDTGRMGTRLEIMQNSIDRRLIERDQDRAEVHPLSIEKARYGVRLLAAACTLAQNPAIRVPDGAEGSKGLAIQSVLPDWDDTDQTALLSRPIFDEAIYGTVRFHHRSVREYLTAEWFAELLERETSRRKLESLFFRNQYGSEIVVPTLRPVLPWLAILDQKLSQRIKKVKPEVFFEGGDPSQLPLEVRRYILQEVCEQIASGDISRAIRDYGAVQRFANPDLTNDICSLLQKYVDNGELIEFLLRMVWLGQLTGALPEALRVALDPTAEKYARTAAFKAVKVTGSQEDQENIRQSFLAEATELNREWLTELIKGTQPTEQTVAWLLACLAKSQVKERFSVDYLTNAVTEFISDADIELLSKLVEGLNRLLDVPPMIERRYCEISEKFQWLTVPASTAVKRLVLARHPTSLHTSSLAVLHKCSTAYDYGIDGLAATKEELSKLVSAWNELNRALFWFEVEKSREALDKKRGERLVRWWNASLFESFWQFSEDDFEYISEEIASQTLLDNRLVALSLAFDLYWKYEKPSQWLTQLQELAASEKELTDYLKNSLKPPNDKDSHCWKQQKAEREKLIKARQEKQEKYHTDWKTFFSENLDEAKAMLEEQPGKLTNPLLYLFDRIQDNRSGAGRWAESKWRTLIADYGEEVAQFYRDSTVSFWRQYVPKLRSEGAPFNETPYAVIIGLTGIEIEFRENKDWLENLNVAEVERACRYASFELNGFPVWFPKLFETYPEIVSDFLLQEIRYELAIEKPGDNRFYMLSDVRQSGQWAWENIAPSIYELLKQEPKNLANLDDLLEILQASSVPDTLIAKLASRKCRTLKRPAHAARWFAVWIGVAPEIAISVLESKFTEIAEPKAQTFFAMIFVTHLLGGHTIRATYTRQAFKTPHHLKSLYLLMHEYIRHEEDIDRTKTGAYSPELRDEAQRARDTLFSLLNQIPGKDSFLALRDIAELHLEEEYRSWILHHATTKAEQDGDIEAWSASQVRDYHDNLERTPSNHRELAELAVLRLLDLKDDLEEGDSSVANILQKVTRETEMRNYIGRELREKAFGRYSIPQEEELADAKRPDLRFHGVGFDGPVPVELKLAEKWSGSQLFERLENQLCGDYLRDNRSNRGLFVLVYQSGTKTYWDLPSNGSRTDFEGVILALQDYWQNLSPKFPNVDDIEIIGVDLTKRAN
jgi:hypothetical protein